MAEESVGAVCTIKWKDTQEVLEGYYIKFGKDKYCRENDLYHDPINDDDVFFYVKNEEELKTLNEEFEVVEYKLCQNL